MIIPLLLLMQFHGFMLQTLPISPLPWFAITVIVALLVIVVAAALYMIAPILNSSAMQQWSRFQIYEALLSVALIILFLGVVKLLFLNPQAGFSSAGLVPTGCTNATTIFTLSACDLSQFNSASYSIAGYMWAFAFAKALLPSTTFSILPVPQEKDIVFKFSIPNILDSANTTVMNYMLMAILAALLLSQLELVVLSSSLMLLSLFFTIGLIARVFGISRSFGGAMIAFGIGLGIIYPLLVSITYGYIDVSANTYCTILTNLPACAASAASSIQFGSSFFTFFLAPFAQVGSLFSTALLTVITSPVQSLAAAMAAVFKEIGYVLTGLMVIPLINIAIIDVFIVDFSRAMGEQMSFSMLFKGVI